MSESGNSKDKKKRNTVVIPVENLPDHLKSFADIITSPDSSKKDILHSFFQSLSNINVKDDSKLESMIRSFSRKKNLMDLAPVFPVVIQTLLHTSHTSIVRGNLLLVFWGILYLLEPKKIHLIFSKNDPKLLGDCFTVLRRNTRQPFFPKSWLPFWILHYKSTMTVLDTMGAYIRKNHNSDTKLLESYFTICIDFINVPPLEHAEAAREAEEAERSESAAAPLREPGILGRKNSFFGSIYNSVSGNSPDNSKLFSDPMEDDSEIPRKLGAELLRSASIQSKASMSSRGKKLVGEHNTMTVSVIRLLQKCWDACIPVQKNFIPKMVGPILSLVSNKDTGIRKVALGMYVNMYERLAKDGHSFQPIEFETAIQMDFTRLDSLAVDMVQKAFSESPYLSRKNRVKDLSRLCGYLFGIGSCAGGLEYELEKCLYMDDLLKHLKKTKRHVMFMLYVGKLTKSHLLWKNYGEAAATILLYADMLEFSDRELPALVGHPAELEWQRKERLMRQAISFYDRTQMWERCVQLLNFIKQGMDRSRLDLPDIKKQEEKFINKINTQERFFAEYFKLTVFGTEAPKVYKNRDIIWRAAVFERLGTITETLKTRFPKANVIQGSKPPTSEERNKPGLFIQLVHVQPSNEYEMRGQETKFDPRIPLPIQAYMSRNECNIFSNVRMVYPAGYKKKPKEELDMIARYTFSITVDKFPRYVRFNPVDQIEILELSPVENAVAAIAKRNKDLATVAAKLEKDPDSDLNILTMLLNGMIDAAVNGGVQRYVNAFIINREFQEKSDSRTKESIEKLKRLLNDQLFTVQSSLILHGELCPANMKGLQEKMEEFFAKMSVDIGKYVGFSAGGRGRRAKTEGSGKKKRSKSKNRSNSVFGRNKVKS